MRMVTFALLLYNTMLYGQVPEPQRLLQAGWDHYVNQRYAQARVLNDSAIQAGLISGDLKAAAQGLLNRGILLYKLEKYDSAIESYLGAFQLYASRQDSLQMIHSLRNVALTYNRLSRFQQSINYCHKALALAKGKKYDEARSWILNSLANNYESVRNFQKAKEALTAALCAVSDSSRRAAMLNNLGSIHLNLGTLDSGIYYFKQSLTIRGRQNDSIKYALVLNNLGETYILADSFDLAEAYLTRSLTIRLRLDTTSLISSYNNLAHLFLQKETPQKAIQFLIRSERHLRRNQNERETQKYLSVKRRYFEMTGDYKQALLTHEKLDSLNRKIFQEERLKVDQLQAAYEINERDQRLKLQEQDLKLHLASIQEKTFINQLTITGSVLLIIVAGAFFYLYRVNSRLRYKNEILVHEQNHRVKNNLQMIASLMSIQSSSNPDESVRMILSQNESRIHSIALLHRMLYNDEVSASVSLSGYLSDLTQELKYALGASNATINLSSEIEKLPIESTVSIGLILNELVTNSVKYASSAEALEVSIAFRQCEGIGHLEYSDNGKNFVAESFNKAGTFGSRLISIQSRQMNGKYSVSNANGFNFKLSFPLTS